MDRQGNTRPSVRSSPGTRGYGSDQVGERTEGAKNTCVRKGCHRKTNLAIMTYNIRTMSTDDKVDELEEELKQLRWDIMGLCEIRRKGEQCITLRSNNVLYYRGVEEEVQENIGGVGFIINKNITNNILTYNAKSNRVAYIILKITKHCKLKIIQIYAPTSAYEQEVIDTFYEEVTSAINENHCQYTLVMGDFNAKIGSQLDPNENRTGKFGLGTRNERGAALVNYLEQQQLYAMNTFFYKKPHRKWTWVSPNGEVKNEIDFILSTERRIVKDVTVINNINTGSDHRIVRARIEINEKMERKRFMTKSKTKIDTQILKENKTQYQNEIRKVIKSHKDLNHKSIDEINEILIKALVDVGQNVAKRVQYKKKIWSNKTEQLFEERRTLLRQKKRNTIQYIETNKTLKKSIKEDKRKHLEYQIEEIIEKNKNMKAIKRNLGKVTINSLKDENGQETKDRDEILRIIENYYTELYEPKNEPPEEFKEDIKRKVLNVNSEEIPEITEEEIVSTLRSMKNNKTPGTDDVVVELIKEGDKLIIQTLKILLNKCLSEGQIPTNWNTSSTILLFKKGDKKILDNYRPISLLSQIYKLFTRIIINRLENKLESNQTIEQAGFRKNFSTSDHLLTIRTLIEKATEYNLTLYLIFIDYQKAFDSIETWAVEKALNNNRIDYRYTQLIRSIYNNTKMTIEAHEKTKPIPIKRGVRQGDPMSPKLFNAALENIFRDLEWDEMGININGERLHHLRFADDVVIISDNVEDVQKMLNDIKEKSERVGLKLNRKKTKVMTNDHNPQDIKIDNETLDYVEEYVYLGQMIQCGKPNQTAEIERRIRLAWAAFGKQRNILTNKKIPLRLRRNVYNQCVLPVFTYAAQTWTLTRSIMDRLAKTQRAMERQMLDIKIKDKIRNEYIREKTKLIDVKEHIAGLKWRWAGHTMRQSDNRWNRKIQDWRPWLGKRSRGRPQTRWKDDLKLTAGLAWTREAQDRDNWRTKGEAYVRYWMQEGY